MRNIRTFVMMGAPGSGKGTQAKLLSEKVGGSVFTSGDEFRALAASQAYVGRHLKASLDAGQLMPHWLAAFVFEKALLALEPEDVIVFGGSCRTRPEAELLHEVLAWLDRPYIAVYLEVSEEEAARRLQERQQREGRRDDDQKTFHTRMDEFNNKTLSAIDYFRTKETLIIVSGEQRMEDTHKSVCEALGLPH